MKVAGLIGVNYPFLLVCYTAEETYLSFGQIEGFFSLLSTKLVFPTLEDYELCSYPPALFGLKLQLLETPAYYYKNSIKERHPIRSSSLYSWFQIPKCEDQPLERF